MIRVGLVGHGLAGTVFHGPLIDACNGLELTGVLTSRDHELRADSLDELMSSSDLIVIASPNRTHFALAKAALESGKHVVVDKPFTVTLEEADELIALAAQYQRVLTVFHNRRWDGDFQTVERILPELGDVLLFEANWDRFEEEDIAELWKNSLDCLEVAIPAAVVEDGKHALILSGQDDQLVRFLECDRERLVDDECSSQGRPSPMRSGFGWARR